MNKEVLEKAARAQFFIELLKECIPATPGNGLDRGGRVALKCSLDFKTIIFEAGYCRYRIMRGKRNSNSDSEFTDSPKGFQKKLLEKYDEKVFGMPFEDFHRKILIDLIERGVCISPFNFRIFTSHLEYFAALVSGALTYVKGNDGKEHPTPAFSEVKDLSFSYSHSTEKLCIIADDVTYHIDHWSNHEYTGDIPVGKGYLINLHLIDVFGKQLNIYIAYSKGIMRDDFINFYSDLISYFKSEADLKNLPIKYDSLIKRRVLPPFIADFGNEYARLIMPEDYRVMNTKTTPPATRVEYFSRLISNPLRLDADQVVENLKAKHTLDYCPILRRITVTDDTTVYYLDGWSVEKYNGVVPENTDRVISLVLLGPVHKNVKILIAYQKSIFQEDFDQFFTNLRETLAKEHHEAHNPKPANTPTPSPDSSRGESTSAPKKPHNQKDPWSPAMNNQPSFFKRAEMQTQPKPPASDSARLKLASTRPGYPTELGASNARVNKMPNLKSLCQPKTLVRLIEITYDFNKFRQLAQGFSECFVKELGLDSEAAFSASVNILQMSADIQVLFQTAYNTWSIPEIVEFLEGFDRAYEDGLHLILSYLVVDEFILALARRLFLEQPEPVLYSLPFPRWVISYINRVEKSFSTILPK